MSKTGRQEGIMNLKHLSEKLGLEENEYIEFLHLFIDSSAADLAKLQSAVLHEDKGKAAEIAHSLKGAAMNMGLAEFFEVAEELEDGIHRGLWADVDHFIRKLLDLLATLTRMSQ